MEPTPNRLPTNNGWPQIDTTEGLAILQAEFPAKSRSAVVNALWTAKADVEPMQGRERLLTEDRAVLSRK